jgi:ATP synthase F1 delta subunit
LLIHRHKVSAIRKISGEYHKLVASGLKEIEIEVTSAQPLNEALKQVLRSKLEKKFQKTLEIVERVDPGLLGGFTILVHNQLLDLSIKGKLIELKKQLLKAKL